jgi:hypothetical protein
MTPSISLTKTEFCEVLRRFVTAGETEPGRESGRDRSLVFQ